MSRIFEIVPYILALGTIALGAFEIAKNWKEYKSSWLRISVSVVFMVVAALSIASLYHDSQEKKETKNKAEGDMKSLQSEVKTANQAQEDNTRLFLDSFRKMSTQVSDLKADVKTEELQKRLAGVQAELLKNQEAMAPGPKAELIFSFVPFYNPPSPGTPTPTKEVTVHPNSYGSVHVEFAIANPTKVDAIDAAIDLQICEQCRYAKEPLNFTRLRGMGEGTRYVNFSDLHALEASEAFNLDVIPPAGVTLMTVGFGYRCRTCTLHTGLSPETTGTIHIQRP